ncbi:MULTISPECIES: class I SAM-dependent methyltransferase [unclassified Nitrospina]|uniref:class I SAM-dependent methyltransferase n=1 Tax=unclassified Nitrospina TaxID=2638683 RepID=UPI003F97AEA5
MQWDDQTEDLFKNQADGVLQVLREMGIPHQRLLDFGSGSGALTRELQNRGYDVTALDPMEHGFLKEQNYPRPFDAVVAVEVIEHLPNPLEEIRDIVNVMVPGGVAVFSTAMTTEFVERADATSHFGNWWYKDDPTHIGFLCERTVAVIGGLGQYTMGVVGTQMFTLQK